MRNVLRHQIANRERLCYDVEGDDARGRCPKDAPVVARGHVGGVYESSLGSPVTVAGAGVGTGTLSDSVSSPHNTQASKNAPTLTAISATLNVGHRESPNPMSMKSTTPARARLMRSIRFPTAPPHTSASETVRMASPCRVAMNSRPRMTSATIVSTMKIQREYWPTCSPNAAPGL